ncbi:hypothetical protein BDW22DRAFT_698724 [Trametopsis cervina]|nr:hypothetical protein BDW22DRAFT_698724 [Trametopsis cervina]
MLLVSERTILCHLSCLLRTSFPPAGSVGASNDGLTCQFYTAIFAAVRCVERPLLELQWPTSSLSCPAVEGFENFKAQFVYVRWPALSPSNVQHMAPRESLTSGRERDLHVSSLAFISCTVARMRGHLDNIAEKAVHPSGVQLRLQRRCTEHSVHFPSPMSPARLADISVHTVSRSEMRFDERSWNIQALHNTLHHVS